MYTKQQISDLREALDSVEYDRLENNVGICSNMRRYLMWSSGWDYPVAQGAADELITGWPLRSECPTYVVPASRGNLCANAARRAYDYHPHWHGEQLELRLDLLAYMRTRLEALEESL